jgi:hypothetical protein
MAKFFDPQRQRFSAEYIIKEGGFKEVKNSK